MKEFELDSILPRFIINSDGEKEPFELDRIRKSLVIDIGLDDEISNEIIEAVVRKIIGLLSLKHKSISTYAVKDFICEELTSRSMDKYREIYERIEKKKRTKFALSEEFIDHYREKQPEWGPLGYITYKRTYARPVDDENRTEEFFETIRRVVEGCFSLQKEHCLKLGLPWNEEKARKSAEIMYQKMWNFKFSAPGRGLWVMGTPFIDKHGSMALNNCGFCSTEDIDIKGPMAFQWCMDALMLGVGVGFDTKGAGKIILQQPKLLDSQYTIPDSREGWVKALEKVLEGFFYGKEIPEFDYSQIRPAGAPIKGFGGVASGPGPLKEMLDDIRKMLLKKVGQAITSIDIVDIFNLIGKCVVAGNVRRSAEIALGSIDDHEFITMKQDKELMKHHRWASNNSVIATVGMDYSPIVDAIATNGEPGVLWLENAQKYSRINGEPDFKDKKAKGVNPCVTGDTLIAVSDGRDAVPIRVLAEEGSDVPVYCKNNEGITQIRMLRNPRITGYNEQIYEVKLDDESIIRCTGNHKFFLRNMNKREAQRLKTGDSLIISSQRLENESYNSLGVSTLIENSVCYNHKVVSVKKVGFETVYNGTVDEFHNYGIILNPKKTNSRNLKLEMIFTANCGEQTLESFELCCLVETFPSRHDSYEEFQDTLKYAYLYAKSVTLENTHWAFTNAVMGKNRRIGTSQSGIVDAFVRHGRKNILAWCEKGYNYLKELDEKYSDWLCIPKSIKITSVKPSGTVSLLAGVSPGIHYPHSEYYIRRMRLATNSQLIPVLKEAGYNIVSDVYSNNAMVAEFPIHEKHFRRSKFEVSMWEQLENAAAYQKFWSDNQVSVTVTFKKDEIKDIAYALECYESRLKSVSFLPIQDHGYEQAPYEEITKEHFEEMKAKIRPINLKNITTQAIGEEGCTTDICEFKKEIREIDEAIDKNGNNNNSIVKIEKDNRFMNLCFDPMIEGSKSKLS